MRRRPRHALARATALALSVALASPGEAKTRADCERELAPQRAQEGKDVIWEPTPDAVVARMLELAGVTAADKVYDLGAGDGKIPIAAAKDFGATAVGIEYDPGLVRLAQCLVEAEGLSSRVTIVQGDIFAADFGDATVVALYLLPALNLRLRPTLLSMAPGTRVVSYSFGMGDWEPDAVAETDDGVAYLWVVPADAAGSWTLVSRDGAERFELTLEQTFQRLAGSAGGARLDGGLRGAAIDVAFRDPGGPARFTGRIAGDRISGTLTRGAESAEYVGTRE